MQWGTPNLDPGAPPAELLSRAPLSTNHQEAPAENLSSPHDVETVASPSSRGIGNRAEDGSLTDSPTATLEYQIDLELMIQTASKQEGNSEAGTQEKQVAEPAATTSLLAQAVPHAPEPDPESAPQDLLLLVHSPTGGFEAPDKTVHGQAPPLAHVQSDLGFQAMRVPQEEELSKSVLHLRVHIPSPCPAPLT